MDNVLVALPNIDLQKMYSHTQGSNNLYELNLLLVPESLNYQVPYQANVLTAPTITLVRITELP